MESLYYTTEHQRTNLPIHKAQSGKTSRRASNLINVIRGKLRKTSERRGAWRGGGGGSGIHPCLYVRKLSVFSFKASLCAGVREGGLLYTGYFKLKRDCKSPCDVSVYASIELECPGRYHQVHQINRSLFRTNIIDTTPIIW